MAQEIADSKLLDTWGSGGTKIEPDITKIIEGWQLGEQPPHEYMNWLQNTFGSKLNHILKNGIAEWNNETEYLAGSSVKHSGNVWICETTNTNSEPTDLNANWEKVAINKDLTVTVDTLADLRSISYPANIVWASGYHTKNDGAFGSHIFRLKGVKTTETDNGGTVIIATIGGVDYVYELQYSGAVNAKWFGVKDDLSYDSVSSFEKALSVSLNINIDDTINGIYISRPINSLMNMAISGRDEILNDRERGASIYAPNGFILNGSSNAERQRITVENLHIYGNNTVGSIGIEGSFGGRFEGNYIDKFDTLISNADSFLTDYIRNKFGDSNIGLELADANEVNILRNWFSSSCLVQISNYGNYISNNSYPINIVGNNFNVHTTTLSMKLTGQLNFSGNYVECFGAGAEDYLIEFVAGRFRHETIVMKGNHINGQGVQPRFIRIVSDNISGTYINGIISNNWMRGFTQPLIKIGGRVGFYDLVEGINVKDNSTSLAKYVEYSTAEPNVQYNQNHSLVTSAAISIPGLTYVTFPFISEVGFNSEVIAGQVKIKKSGTYLVTVTMKHIYTAPLRNLEFQLMNSGVPIYSSVNTLPAIVAGGNNFNTVTFSKVVNLSAADSIYVRARNGETLDTAHMSIVKLNDSYNMVGV